MLQPRASTEAGSSARSRAAAKSSVRTGAAPPPAAGGRRSSAARPFAARRRSRPVVDSRRRPSCAWSMRCSASRTAMVVRLAMRWPGEATRGLVLAHPLDQRGGTRRGGLVGGVGHVVGDAAVDLVTEAGEAPGTADSAMAKAMRSSSNTARSVREPPPRTRTMTSTAAAATGRGWRAATAAAASVPLHPNIDMGDAEPDAAALSSCRTSCQAALPRLATSPIRSGDRRDEEGGRCARSARPRRGGPAGASRSAASLPSVKRTSMPSITSDSRPVGA